MRRTVLIAVLPASAMAQEFVELPAGIDETAFYRAVACAAPPGGECGKPFLRWPGRTVSFGLAQVAGRNDARLAYYGSALDGALAQINALDLPLRVTREDRRPDVSVHIVATPPYHVIDGTGLPELDGALLELGRVALTSRDGEILRGAIAISAFAPEDEVASILLEEVVQATGLMTDLQGPGADGSLFAEDGNDVVRLEGRDAMALRRHYGDDPDS
ncbi:hypothetical protein [Jannaschia aquimarina]|uniref:Uncharacterized protein n=1 Tax=Jannaschia aquimarina TaxID=935700 RepID=A0A0D1EEE0_9RHOB|nr:hypothetical protein [Jannaschia aquimarina]KIT14260.1 hypothetical protein jaqu_40540 [Jannaschia aquimarina]SNS49449.1 hypothetical protein SAMN05421775_101174 [Jannaschia aquimarina]